MEQGPTERNAGRSTFLLSSGGAGGGYYQVAVDTGPIAAEHQFPCRTLVARPVWSQAIVPWHWRGIAPLAMPPSVIATHRQPSS